MTFEAVGWKLTRTLLAWATKGIPAPFVAAKPPREGRRLPHQLKSGVKESSQALISGGGARRRLVKERKTAERRGELAAAESLRPENGREEREGKAKAGAKARGRGPDDGMEPARDR